MRKRHSKIASLGILVSLFAFSSCVDDDYDLNKDIDLTITVGGNEFAVPGGNTDRWTLDKILDLDAGSIIKADSLTGDYSLRKKGDPIDPSEVKINPVTVNRPDIDPIYIELDIRANMPAMGASASDSVKTVIPAGKESDFKLEKEDMPEELWKLNYVDTRDMMLRLKFEGPAKLSLREVKIKFPEYIDIENVEKGIYSMPATACLNEAGYYEENLKVKGMTVGEGYNGTTKHLLLKGKIIVTGTLWMDKDDVASNGSNDYLTVDSEMSDIVVESAMAKVYPDIDIKVNPVMLDDIPDFLQDDEVRLDLTNPMILLHVVNESPVDTRISGNLVSIKEGRQIAGPVQVKNILVKGNFDNYICLSRTGETMEGREDVCYEVPEMNDLIERIPDQINFVLDAEADSTKEVFVRMGTTYNIEPAYEINAPLSFGENLQIVYTDSVDGWHGDIEDYEIKKAILTAEAYNGIPLDVLLEATAKDEYGNELPGIKAVVDKTIAAAKDDQPVMTSIVITMTEEIPGAMKELDGLLFKAKASSNQEVKGKVLNKEQYLQLQQLKLKVPGGAKIDLN